MRLAERVIERGWGGVRGARNKQTKDWRDREGPPHVAVLLDGALLVDVLAVALAKQLGGHALLEAGGTHA